MKPISKISLFIIFVLVGFLVFGVGGYWTLFSGPNKLIVRIVIFLFFGLFWVLFRQIQQLQTYKQVASGFLVASAAFLVGSFVSDGLGKLIGGSTSSLAGVAMLKLSEMLPLVVTILVLNKILGNDLGEVYIKKGKLGLSLLIGIITMIVFVVIFYFQTQAQNIPVAEILPEVPWILFFGLSNGLLEELHFRGLFLKKFEPFLGKNLSNLAIAIFFAMVHVEIEYSPDIIQFLIIVFFLGLGWGYLTQKTDTLWGSVLSHAGADFLAIAGIISLYV